MSGAGAVAAGHERVARVGADVLERGGNAVDAVVAMVAAGCVCEPTLTSLGGGGFMIVSGPHMAQPVVLDFFTRQPGLGSRPRHAPWEVHALELDGTVLRYGTGPASVAVPGVSRGIAHAARRFGRWPLTRSLEPAVALADGGVALTRTQAGEHDVNASLISRDPHGAALWLVDGQPRGEGTLFRQPELAWSLELIGATDGDAMHVGELATRCMEWSDERGARIAREDLERYEVIERHPLMLCIDDVCMFANPQPSMGGGIAVRLLQEMLLARIDDAAVGRRGVSRDLGVGRALVRVLRHVDPPRTHPPVDGEPVAFARSPNTTHVSAIDGDGMLAGATTTLGYGSGEFIPGSGIQLNNMLAEYDHTIVRPPGATVPSMMTPVLLQSPRTAVQLGSAGSDRIPHALSQILERMWEGMPLEEAVQAPRFAWDGTTLHAEPGLDERAVEQLEAEHALVRWADRDAYFGTSNGTARRAQALHAAGDPRREATGIVV